MTENKKTSKRATCPTCNGHSKSCPVCDGKGTALCQQCLCAIYQGEWAARQEVPRGKHWFTIFVCRKCAITMDLCLEPSLRLVVDNTRKVA